MTIQWSGFEQLQAGKKTVPAKAVLPTEPNPVRFVLWQSGGTQIPTMWTLYDYQTQTQHYLYGEGWEGAQAKAEERIGQVLSPEGWPPPKPKRSRKKTPKP